MKALLPIIGSRAIGLCSCKYVFLGEEISSLSLPGTQSRNGSQQSFAFP